MRRPDHARSHARRTATSLVAVAAGLAAGAVLAVVERPEASQAQTAEGAPASSAAATASPAATASATTEASSTATAAPDATSQAEPLPLASVLPVSDETTVEVDVTGIPLSTWSTGEPVSPWIVVNKSNPLDPIDYAPDDLVTLSTLSGGSDEKLREEAAAALVDLRDAAVDDGLDLAVASAYRSQAEQRVLHAQYVAKWGATKAETFSARAGYSEHQTGWAVDVYWSSACRVKQCFADEPAGEWVAAHAWEHGWIVRYGEDEADTTGYRYEPWHLRYVGIELSTWMHENGVTTLEEALGYPAAPDYAD